MPDPDFEVTERRKVIVEYEVKGPEWSKAPSSADPRMVAAMAAEMVKRDPDMHNLILNVVSRAARRSRPV